MTPARPGLVLAVAALVVAAPGGAASLQQRGAGGFFTLGDKLEERVFEVADGSGLRVDFPEIRFVNADAAITTNVNVQTGAPNVVEVTIYFVSGRMEWARGIVHTIRPSSFVDGEMVVVAPLGDLLRFEQPSWAHSITLFVEVLIPEDFNVSVEVHRGEVSVERLRGSASLASASGDIHVGAVRGTEVSIAAQDGNVTAEEMEAEDGRVTATEGNIEIGTLRGQMYASTADGDGRVHRADGARTTLRSARGNIFLAIDRLASTTLVARDGDITIYAPASLSAAVYFEADEIVVDDVFVLDARQSAIRIDGVVNAGGELLEAMSSGGAVRLSATERNPVVPLSRRPGSG